MQVIWERCCGLDVHKRLIVACMLTPDGREIRTFGTMTPDLRALSVWLVEHGVTHVVMESTGVYWKPIYNILEDQPFTLVVVNAQHVKAVPGRKTDVKDAEWLADLLRHGLVNASFIPDRVQRELRDLIRHRKSLIEERTRLANRLQKALESANIKLASVATDILGKSGRAMIEAIIDGVDDPAVLADLAKGRLRDKHVLLERALDGSIGEHHRFLLASLLRHVTFLDEEIDHLSAEIAAREAAAADDLNRLQTIPGVGRRTAEFIVAEVGRDMSRFRSAGQLASWAGLCPAQNESAGKPRPAGVRHGSPWLRAGLTEAARAAARTRNTYLAAQYRRIAARRGTNRASVAVAHTILRIAYHLLRQETTYRDLGPNYFDEREHQRTVRRAVARLERLGYAVMLAQSTA